MGEIRLTPRQERFADEFVLCGNATEAARRSGYSERTARQIASENLSKPVIRARIQALQQAQADQWEITRQDIISAVLGAVQMAREQRAPAVMVRGLVEIARMMGFYEPELVKNELSDDADRLKAKYAAMSDEELVAVIACGSVETGRASGGRRG